MGNGFAVIRTPDQRLRVFVSSTLQELEPERVAAAEAIRALKLTPVLFELGARPHPPRQLYRAYLEQSHVFVGIYGERYGWIAPGMEISGLDDEYRLSGDRPKLLYVKKPAPGREARLEGLLRRIEEHDRACYKTFSTPEELGAMLSNDLAVLLSERFEASPRGGGRPRATRRTLSAATAAAVVVAAAALVSVQLYRQRDVGPAAAEPGTVAASVAVLPFVNMSPDPDQEYFSDGLTEELLNALTKIPDLKVTGRTSSFSFKGKNEDLRVIGKKLGVANILEGSVRKSGDRLRITAQLVKAGDGFDLWSATYDRTLDDIFAVQDDIAGHVADELKVTLLGRRAGRPRTDAGAYDLVLQARFAMGVRTEENVRRAKALLGRVLQMSPDYAPAWAEMGLAEYREGELATAADARLAASKRARASFARALELDPELAVARSRMAVAQMDSWRFAEAERSTDQALAASPKDPIVLANAGIAYKNLGRREECIALLKRACDADPLSLSCLFNLANAYLVAGRLDEAEGTCRKMLDLAPDDPSVDIILGDVHLLRGEPDAARESYQRFTEIMDLGDWGRLNYAALTEHSRGDAAVSQAAAAEFEKRFGATDPGSVAEIRAWRGEADMAFAWLDKAFEARDPFMSSIKADPLLESLRADPRWNGLLNKVGLPTD